MKRVFSIFITIAVLFLMFVSCFEDENSPTSPDTDNSINVDITSPASGDTFLVDSTIVFIGNASDPEDGILNDSSLVWRVNTFPVDTLGFGDTVKTNTLPEGRHTIILAATDSDGNSNYDYVFLYVKKPELKPLEIIWPNNDGTKWKYQYTQRFWYNEDPLIYYPTESDVPEIPSFSYIEQILGNQPIGNINEENLGVYKLQFAGDTTTGPGVTAQNLRESVNQAQGDELKLNVQSARNSFLLRLCMARPDLSEKIHKRYPELPGDINILSINSRSDRILLKTLSEVMFNPYFIHGGAWEKTDRYIGTYGDLDQSLAWKFLEANLNVSHQFSFQLAPSFASDVFLHCKIIRNFTAETSLGSYENAIECLYIIDYGAGEIRDIYTPSLGYARFFDYGSVIYAPGTGPIYCYERSMLFTGDPPTNGWGDKELILTETNAEQMN